MHCRRFRPAPGLRHEQLLEYDPVHHRRMRQRIAPIEWGRSYSAVPLSVVHPMQATADHFSLYPGHFRNPAPFIMYIILIIRTQHPGKMSIREPASVHFFIIVISIDINRYALIG